MGTRRGASREVFFKGERKAKSIHKKVTDYLKENKPKEIVIKSAFQALRSNDSAVNSIVVSGKAAQIAYSEIKKIKQERKSISDEDVQRVIKKAWNTVKKDEGLRPNSALNRSILGSLTETVEKIVKKSKKRGDSK